jgi:hypothetical protein
MVIVVQMGFGNALNMTLLPPLNSDKEKARWVNVGTAVTPSLPKQVQEPHLRSLLVPAEYTGSSDTQMTTAEYAVQIQTCSGSRLGEAVFLGACVPHTGQCVVSGWNQSPRLSVVNLAGVTHQLVLDYHDNCVQVALRPF